MRLRSRTLTAVSLLAASALALAAADGLTFKRTPKEGESLKYRLKADLDIMGTQASVVGLVTEKTLKVEADGTYSVESTQGDMTLTLGGQEIPAPASAGTVTVYGPGGGVVEMRGENIEANAYRMANLNGFFEPTAPVSVGGEWTREIPANPKTGGVAATATYKYVGDEKVGDVDVAKVTAVVKETGANPAMSESTLWVRKDDFSVVKSESKWTNVPFPAAPAPISGTVSLSREG